MSKLPYNIPGAAGIWQHYPITPVTKPRMTRRDRWKKRPSVVRYFEYRDLINDLGVPSFLMGAGTFFHVVFVLPVPKSWSMKKQDQMIGMPHQQRPDLDNLIKGFLDAVLREDASAWDYRASKIWGVGGAIYLSGVRS